MTIISFYANRRAFSGRNPYLEGNNHFQSAREANQSRIDSKNKSSVCRARSLRDAYLSVV